MATPTLVPLWLISQPVRASSLGTVTPTPTYFPIVTSLIKVV